MRSKKKIRAIDDDPNRVWMLNSYNYWDLEDIKDNPELSVEFERCQKSYKTGTLSKEIIAMWEKEDRIVLLDKEKSYLARYYRICDEIKENYEKTGRGFVTYKDKYYYFISDIRKRGYTSVREAILEYVRRIEVEFLFGQQKTVEQLANESFDILLKYLHEFYNKTGGKPQINSHDERERKMAVKLAGVLCKYRGTSSVAVLITTRMRKILDTDTLIKKIIYDTSEKARIDECHEYFKYKSRVGHTPKNNPSNKEETTWRKWLDRKIAAKQGKGSCKFISQYDKIAKSYGYPNEFCKIDREKIQIDVAIKMCKKYRTLGDIIFKCKNPSKDAAWFNTIWAAYHGKSRSNSYASVDKILSKHFEVRNFCSKSKTELKEIYKKRGY